VGGSGGSAGASGGSGGSGATGGSAGSAGAPLTERRVFVTSGESTAALGGVSGADAQCKKFADQAKLGGAWVAWLSDDTTSPAQRFVKSQIPYVLVGGDTIATDWTDLIDGTLAVPIDRDESGTQLATGSNVNVWTATQFSGVGVASHCMGFTVTTGWTPRGSAASTSEWSIDGPGGCDQMSRLYCFEQ
jgi:hypothetical protein